ncbi:MAG TPA: hypothetical protein VEY30_10420, partial [Myxococcaceae bacterium]|nr:hypothetical protein [Myxococcaceae bacterium]
EEALENIQHVVDVRMIHLHPKHPNTLVARAEHAQILYEKGEREEGIKMIEGVLSDQEEILGSSHPYTLATRKLLTQMKGMS